MAQKHNRIVSAMVPKERLAQLDRLAKKRGVTRSWLLRQAVENLLERSEETMTPEEAAELRSRMLEVERQRRLGEIGRKYRIGRRRSLRISR